MRKPTALNPRLVLATLALSATPALAVDTYFIGGNANWNDPNNWAQVGTDGVLNTGDDVKVKPAGADPALILGGQTVNLNTAESVQEVQVQFPGNAQDTAATPGVARLNILAGATLTTGLNGNNAGIRVGRALDAGAGQQPTGSVRGEIVQTGGEVYIVSGANGLRLSATADSANVNVPDSLYRISGGILRGGNAGANPVIASDIRLGAITNIWGTAELHIVGTGPTEISCLDFQMGASSSTVTGFNGTSLLHFSLDAGGVTPITAADEFQFRGSGAGYGHNQIQIDLVAEPPEADIDLIMADRLNTNGSTTGAANERFENYRDDPATLDVDESLVILGINGRTFTYRLSYQDGADDGTIDARVYLDFISATAVPEPSAVAGLMVGSLALLARRRR